MATENSLVTVAERPWLFPAGKSGNPGGRPKGIAALVREQTADGAELVAYMLKVLRSNRQSTRLRMEAAAWLADRGFGKALQQMELSGPGAEPLTIRIEYGESTLDAHADGDVAQTASGAGHDPSGTDQVQCAVMRQKIW